MVFVCLCTRVWTLGCVGRVGTISLKERFNRSHFQSKIIAHIFNTSISLARAGVWNANSTCMGMLSMLAHCACHKHVQLSASLHV